MDGGFGAPFGGEATDGCVGLFVEAQVVADDAAVEVGAVGVGVREVGGLQLFVAEFIEDELRHDELVVAEGVEVQQGHELRLDHHRRAAWVHK